MGVSESVGAFYAGIEERFYGAMDLLDEKGIPVYAVIDPLEEKGIPFFPVAIAGLILLLLLIYNFALLQVPSVSMKLSLVDDAGALLEGVSIKAFEETSEKQVALGSSAFTNGQRVELPLQVGARIRLEASKEGYEPAGRRVYFDSAEKETDIRLVKISKAIGVSLRLIDDETGDDVGSAKVVARFAQSASVDCSQQGNGTYLCPGVIEGAKTKLTITQQNYEQKAIETVFAEGSVNEFSLVPKAGSERGKTSLIVRVFEEQTKERLGNFTLRIFDAKDGGLITERTESDGDGEQAEKVSKGTSIRIVVEKEGYLSYDSSSGGSSQTLRDDEVVEEVYLRKGTNALTVSVLDAAGRPIQETDVLLFNSGNEPISSKETNLAGEALFEGLSTDGTYFVSAWQDKFIPAREEVELAKKNRVNLRLERGVANNSGSLTVHTTDDKSIAMNDVTLNFYEDVEGKGIAPLGVPAQKTDATGKFVLLSPLGSTIVVKAAKGRLSGEERVKILETFQNEAIIVMREPFSEVLLKALDKAGKEVKAGFLSVVAGNDVLFEGKYEEGGVRFNPAGAKYVNVVYSDDAGSGFEEEVYVQDTNSVTVSPGGAKSSGTTPVLEFLGVYSIDGTKASGLAKGADVFLKFRADFPEGQNRNGIHVRLGEDNTGFVDSQDAGITGFSAVGAAAFYGRSYSPQPNPGFEALDFENSGSEGRYNKWVELYFQSGGERVVKIRAKAKETAVQPETELHYRAWTTIGNRVYRAPVDSSLGLEPYSDERTSLYAQTAVEKVKILEASATCEEDFCASYKFVRKDGSEYSVDNFRPVLGELYALEVSLSPQDAKESITVKASTSKQKPKISFQGFGINNFADFPDINSTDTSMQVDDVPAENGEAARVRLYFKTNDTENASITLQVIAGAKVLNRQFRFSIYREKAFSLRTVPENVAFGQDFVIQLEDSAANPVEDAEIRLLDKAGERIETIKGNGSAKKGFGGRYQIKNTFNAGVLRYEASAQGFRAMQGTIEVTRSGVLEWGEQEIFLVVQKNKQTAEKFIDLKNKSKQSLQGITFEVKPSGAFPEGMEVKVTPVTSLAQNSTQRIVVVAAYNGERETAHGEATIIARGKTETGFNVLAQSRVVVDFNPKINPDCLEFSKKKLVVYVASGFEDRDFYERQYANDPARAPGILPQGEPSKYYKYTGFSASTTESFTAKLGQKPECQLELQLRPEVVKEGRKSDGIEVEAEDIVLLPQLSKTEGRRSDSKEVTVSITNKMIRNYPGKEMFRFNVLFKGEGFAKSIPLEVFVWNPRYALQVSRNIELFLAPYDARKAGNLYPFGVQEGIEPSGLYRNQYSAQVPLFVRNVGEADIENVSFRVSSETSRGNVDVRVVPDFPIQFLRKGEAIDPPKTLVAEVLRNEKTTLFDVKQLDITGVIDGTTFSFGPVIVTSHISSAQCLTAIPGNLAYISTKSTEGAISQDITLRNTCAEEVRVLGISRSNIGNNRLSLAPGEAIIPPGSEGRFSLVLEKRENYNGSPVPVYVNGFLPRSGAPIESTPIVIDVKLGKDVAKGMAATETVTLNVCEGGTKQVRFPIIASGSSPLCDNAYCDSVQLSNYLADRLEEQVRDAEKQIQNRAAEIQRSDCSQIDLARGYCTFDGLGVKKQTFFAYFSHDNLSPAMLQKAMQAKNGTIRNFRADFFSGKAGGEYLGGYSRQVFLNSSFRGCGRYTITLNGSVAIQASRIVPELMNIVVDIVPEEGAPPRQVTEQCLPNIQNVTNFLPRDEGLTKNQKYDTWAGMIEPKDQSLEQLGAETAKSLFGSEQRAIQGSVGTNAMSLELANTEGYLVRVEMDKTPSENPLTVRGLVRQSLGADEKLQHGIVKEAGQALRDLREIGGNINGCIGEDESYMLLKSTKDLGEVKLHVDPLDSLKIQYESLQCMDFNVSSNIRESVALSSRKLTEFDGLKENPVFRKASTGLAEDTEFITTLLLDRLEEKSGRYRGEARVCATGNPQFSQAQGKKIAVGAKRLEGQAKKPQEAEVPLQVCGIHPLKFLEKAQKDLKPTKGSSKYYATFIWKGEPEQLSLADLSKLSEVDDAAKKAQLILEKKREIQEKDKPGVVKAKTNAAHAYVAACGLTSIATSLARPTVGLWTAFLLNPLVDCAVPYFALLGEGIPAFSGVSKIIEEVFKPIKMLFDGITWAIAQPIKWIFNTLFGTAAVGQAQEQVSQVDSKTIDTVVDSFVDAAIVKDSILAAVRTKGATVFDDDIFGDTKVKVGGSVNEPLKYLSKARLKAGIISDAIVDEMKKKYFGNSTATEVKSLLETELRPKLKKNMEKAFIEEAEASIKGKRVSGTGGLNIEKQIEVARGAYEKTIKDDAKLFIKLYKARANFKLPDGESIISVTDDTVEKYVKELDLPSRITGSQDFGRIQATAANFKSEAQIRTTLGTKITDFETQIRNAVKDRLKADLKVSALPPNLAAQINNVKMPLSLKPEYKKAVRGTRKPGQFDVPDYTKVDIAPEDTRKMVSEIEEVIKQDTVKRLNNPTATPSAYEQALQKKFGSAGIKKIGINADEAVKDAKLSVFGKGGVVFLKNLIKEGAFGVAANYVGLRAYDKMLDYQLGKLNINPRLVSRDEELQRAGAVLLGQLLESENRETPFLLKYRTYRISVNDKTGQQVIRMGLAESIPAGVEKDFVLNDCQNPGFDEEVGAVLPGLLPDADRYPAYFRNDAKLKNLHVAMVSNYLKRQSNGERIGTLVGSAVKDYREGFNAIGLNADALVVSIGAVKSGLGTTDQTRPNMLMFGCNLSSPATQDPYNNALCAIKKLDTYRAECANKAPCYLKKYSEEQGNQKTNVIGNVTDQQFLEIYNSWTPIQNAITTQ